MKTCINCRWSVWSMTNHATPRINKNNPGRCAYEIDMTALSIPAAVRPQDIRMPRMAIWADKPHQDCPVWEAQL